MARIRQQFPQGYNSNSPIHTEFENVIRYLNSAELGNKTVGELLKILFNDEGEFDGPIELQLDSTLGLQYRIGEYTDPTAGWITIATLDDLRGAPGLNFGQVSGPLFYNREDIIVAGAPTFVTYSFYAHPDLQDIVVYLNGSIQEESSYTFNIGNGEIDFGFALTPGWKVTVYTIRAAAVPNYSRLDFTATVATPTVAFAHTTDDRVLVYRNGLLQQEGGVNDYTSDPNLDIFTFFPIVGIGEKITFINAENSAVTNVGGLMLEDEYTNSSGFIEFSKIAILDDEIPQSKVDSLVANLSNKANETVGASTPISPTVGDLWLDTSLVPNILKFYDGVQFQATSPASQLPNFTITNANQYLRVNGTGSALAYGPADFSSLVPLTFIGAANGVPSLDSLSKIPFTQLPILLSKQTWGFSNPASANTTFFVTQSYGQKVYIEGLSFILGVGTCDIEIMINGVSTGTIFNVDVTQQQQQLPTAVFFDSSASARSIGIRITNRSGPAATLQGCISIASEIE